MHSVDELLTEIRRLRASRELNLELGFKLSSTKGPTDSRKYLYAREQVLRSTFRIRELLKARGLDHG